MHMKFSHTDPGFCRAYFRTEKGTLVCVQEECKNGYKVYRCTEEEEPEYSIKLDGVTMDRIPVDAGSSDFFIEMNDWMQRRGLFGGEAANA
jgi:hypothetical protein